MKKCNKCNINKNLSDFNKRKASKDGHSYTCKSCKSTIDKEYSQKNSERIKNYLREYNLLNSEKVKKVRDEYYISNKDKINESNRKNYYLNKDHRLEKAKKYYEENKSDIIEKVKNRHKEDPSKGNLRSKRYRIENKEKVKEYQILYRIENKDRLDKYKEEYRQNKKDSINESQRKYYKSRKYLKAWRGLIFRYYRMICEKKRESTYSLLGYSPSKLKERIECQFKDGMDWSNYGEWQIDHKKPMSKFDKNTPASVVNMLSNLQPLWREDNRKKSNIWK